MPLTASTLRQDIYRILDQVLETGVPVEVQCKGRVLRISAVEAVDKRANLERRNFLVGAPESLVHLDWSAEWTPDLPGERSP